LVIFGIKHEEWHSACHSNMEVSPDLRLSHPFSCVVNGPSGVGKTEWIRKLIYYRDDMIKNTPGRIIWCYTEYQPIFAQMPEVEFVEGLNFKLYPGQRHLIILDDMMMSVNKDITQLFVSGRHRNISVIFVTHNIFYPSKEMRTIKLNTKHMVLFENTQDASQINYLGRQMFPDRNKHMREAYMAAIQNPYGYLFVDMRHELDKRFRLRTRIFPGEEQLVYFPM